MECGCKLLDVKKALNFDIGKISGAIITHEHKDHAGRVYEYLKAGIDVYASRGTIEALKIKSNNLHGLTTYKSYSVGGFAITAFDVKHDSADPVGYVIKHADLGTLLFVTDSYYIPYTFKGLNHILVEANYDDVIIRDNIKSGKISQRQYDRVLQSHMSIDTCIAALKANDLSGVQNIVLLHLSDANSDAAAFQKRVEDATNKPTFVAEKNLVIHLTI